MLQTERAETVVEHQPIAGSPGATSSLVATARLVRAYARQLVAWVVFCLVLASMYLLWVPSEYTASSQIILQPRRPTVVTQSSDNQVPQTLDTPQIDSQIEVIGSQRVLQPVFDVLELQDSPEFHKQKSGLLQSVKSLFVGRQAEGKPDYLALADRVTARRVGQSLVLTISVRASDPDMAAKLANSVTASFLREEIDAKLSEVQRNGDWLQTRIEDIRKQLDAAKDAMRSGTPTMGPFSASDARILTTASPPTARSSPKPTLTLAFAIALALGSGLAFIALRKGFDARVWSVEQAMLATGLSCLTVLPMTANARTTRGRLSASVDQPRTDYARHVRILRDAVLRQADRSGLVIGVVSAREGAGTSMLAANLAHAIARSGTPCVLVDGDLQEASLTTALAPSAADTLLERVRQPHQSDQVAETSSGIRFLPARRGNQEAPPDLYLGMPRVATVLRGLDSSAIVIVDLPAIDAGSDATSLASHLDGVLLLAREGHVTTEQLWQAVNALSREHVPIFGLVYSTDTRSR